MYATNAAEISFSSNTPSAEYGFYDNPLSRAAAIFIRVQEFLERGTYRDVIGRDETRELFGRLTYSICDNLLTQIKSNPLIHLVPKEVNVEKAPGVYSYLNLKELTNVSIRSENTHLYINSEKFAGIKEVCRARFGTGSGNIRYITIRRDALCELEAYRDYDNRHNIRTGYYARSRVEESKSTYTVGTSQSCAATSNTYCADSGGYRQSLSYQGPSKESHDRPRKRRSFKERRSGGEYEDVSWNTEDPISIRCCVLY